MRNLVLIIAVMLLCSCTKIGSEEKSSKESSETVLLAAKIDLFNSTEKLIEKIYTKKYIELYDSLKEIYELSNKANLVSEKTDASANKYIQNLNQLSEDIYNEANKQKSDEIYYAYEKSQLTIISSVASGGDKKQESSGGESSGGGSKEGSGGGDTSGSSSGGESSGGGGEEKQEQPQIVIPQEEALKKYPEIIFTEQDKKILDLTVDLLGYISKVSLESDKENPTTISNREKYLLYKITTLSKLNEYREASDLVSEAQNNWDALYIKVQEENKQDAATINALLKNIKTSVDKKNPVAIELQTKIAIKLLENLSTKSK
jgi:hypothetical protein